MRNQFGKNIRTLACLVVCLVTALLSACAVKGDFGRPQKMKLQELTIAYARDFIASTIGGDYDPAYGRYKSDPFGLTKHEIIVRDSARHFGTPLTKHYTAPGKPVNPTAFAEYLTSERYTHGGSRMGLVTAEIKSDFIWLKRFGGAARKVKIDDGDRAYYLETNTKGLTDQDRVRTYSRIKANELFVYGAFKDLDDRIASYTYAIKRVPLEIPGESTEAAKVALAVLRKEAALLRTKYDKLARRIARWHAKIPKRWHPRLRRHRLKRKRRKGKYMRGRGKNNRNAHISGGRNGNNRGTRNNVRRTSLSPLTPKFMKKRKPIKKKMQKKTTQPVKSVMPIEKSPDKPIKIVPK